MFVARFAMGLIVACAASAHAYDPFTLEPGAEVIELVVEDARRARTVPVRAYLPKASAAAPIVIVSHGLGGSREGAPSLGEHWAGRGYVVAFLQHPGSDDSVWKDVPRERRMAALKQAASVQNLLERVRDVTLAIDQLSRWQRADGHVLRGRLDLNRIGMAGHSFGALTAQSIGGQTFMSGKRSFVDDRVKAALILSPSVPARESALDQAFARVRIPWLLMTGTRDDSPIGDNDATRRLAVFAALPAGNKYELVLDGGEHSTFVDRALPGDRATRLPEHVRAIHGLSTAFWDAFLRDDATARAWLDGDGARSVLQRADRWQRK